MKRGLGILGVAIGVGITSGARGDGGVAEGRWASTDHVTSSGTAKAGARFFLDVVVAKDGSFKGTWELYVCFNYPGAYGVAIVSCQRSKEGKAATGRFDLASESGRIALEGLGESAFKLKLTSGPKTKLDLELPRDWQKQGAPVLYETSLSPK